MAAPSRPYPLRQSRSEQAARYAPSLSNVAEHVRDAEYALTDAAAEISDYLDNAMFDANELDEIESRLEVIYRLSLKYGGNGGRNAFVPRPCPCGAFGHRIFR